MMAQAEKLEATLRHFGVEGKVTAIVPGPVVSRFECEPAPGRQDQPGDQPQRRPGPGLKGPVHPHRGAGAGQGGHRHRDPQPQAPGGGPPGNPGRRRLQKERLPPDGGPGERHHGHPGGIGPGQNAPPPHRRGHGQRQKRGPERHDPVHPLQGHAGAGAVSADRPQAHRAVHLPGHPAPSAPRGGEPPGGHHCAALGRGRNGKALCAAVRPGGAQHRGLQPEGQES